MSDDLRIAFFKWLRLGDAVLSKPKLTMRPSAPSFQSSNGGTRAHGTLNGPNIVWEVAVDASFIRNFEGDESLGAFHDRIRQFLVDLVDAVAQQTGHSPAGPLCFVRFPLGIRGPRDSSTVDESGGVVEGDGVSLTLDHDVQAIGWEEGQKLLFVSPGNISTFDWEVCELLADPVAAEISVDLSYPKQDADSVYRLEWYMPEVALSSQVGTDATGAGDFAPNKVTISMTFSGVLDLVNGGIA